MFDAWHDVRRVSDLDLGLPATTYSEECVYKRCSAALLILMMRSSGLGDRPSRVPIRWGRIGLRSRPGSADYDAGS